MPMGRRMEFVEKGNVSFGFGDFKIKRSKLLFGLDIYWEEFSFDL